MFEVQDAEVLQADYKGILPASAESLFFPRACQALPDIVSSSLSFRLLHSVSDVQAGDESFSSFIRNAS